MKACYKIIGVAFLIIFISNVIVHGQTFEVDTLLKVPGQENIQTYSLQLPSASNSSLDSLKHTGSDTFFLAGIKDFFKQLPTSQINIGYDYGLVPGYDYNLSFPIGTFVSDGNISMPLFHIPLQASYHYSAKKSSFGLNNYFRVGYDYQSFQKNINEKKGLYIQKLTGQLDSLTALKQNCLQKASYWHMVENNLTDQLNLSPDNSLITKAKESLTTKLNDSLSSVLGKEKSKVPMDSSISRVNDFKQIYDTTNVEKEANHLIEKQKLNDSIDKIKKYEEKFFSLYNKCADEIEKMQATLDDVKSASGNPVAFLNTLSPVEKVMLYTKKLDVGLCYPSSSMFLVNNVPLRGLQYEWSNDDYYFSASAGLVQNNFLFNSNLLQNTLIKTQNLFNFFDFGNLNQGRKVVSIKGGIGKQDDTHFYVGWLSGWGLQSYATIDSETVLGNSQNKEYNAVIELDGRWQIAKSHSIEAIFSRSALKNSAGETVSDKESISSQLFGAGNQNNAFYLRYRGEILKTRTSLTATGRYIEPLFQSFGTGFMQSNNVRYEFRIDQYLFSSLKISGFIKQEHDNVLSLMQYTNTIRSAGISLSGNVSRNLTVAGSYSPVFQHIDGEGTGLIMKNQNDISNINIIYSHRMKKSFLTVNGIYCIYRLSDTSNNVNLFNNAGIYLALNGSKLTERVSMDYFNSNLLDSVSSITWLYSFDLTCIMMHKLTAMAELRCAVNATPQPSFGGILKLTYACLKFCSISVEGDRIVKGDFYTEFPSEIIDKFPYMISTRLIFNL